MLEKTINVSTPLLKGQRESPPGMPVRLLVFPELFGDRSLLLADRI